MPLILKDAEDTVEFGRMLAEAMSSSSVRSLYLFADLGGGKTTLTRGFVSALPGGENAEVASPSFTLCNIYPTRPEVLHADLYRLSEGASMPEEMEELMEPFSPKFEETLKSLVLPTSEIDLSFDDYARVICALLEIPVKGNIIESLHHLFSLYSAFAGNTYFQSETE